MKTLAEVIRDEIKRYPTAPSTYPPFAPTFLATEHTIADAVTAHLAAILADVETWEAVTARLAQVAERNMPGWDAGEMANEAIAVFGARLGLA